MCDCGDPEAWRQEGNCSDHTGFTNDNFLELDLSEEFIQQFTTGWLRCFYYLFYYLERPSNTTKYNLHVTKIMLEIFRNMQQ